MTIKEKKEIIEMLKNYLKADLNKQKEKYMYDIYDMENFDEIMSDIMQKQKSVKTIKDLIELEDCYDKLENWFLHNKYAYIYDKYIYGDFVDDFMKFKTATKDSSLKDVEFYLIYDTILELRKKINKEIREVDASFIFKDFHDYVDKVWEAI